jgi:Tol biopolymer transport system component
MKRLIALALLLLGAAPCYPQDSGAGSIDYGTRFNIMPGSFTTKLDRSYLYTADTRMVRRLDLMAGKIQEFPVWSPDGKYIAYTDLEFIFLVPVEGGTPEMVYDGIYLHPYNGGQLALLQTIQDLIGFSPDGESLYFNAEEIIPSSVDIQGNCVSASGIMCVKRLDLKTGAAEKILGNIEDCFLGCALSSSGRYLGYYEMKSGTYWIKDLTGPGSWTLPEGCVSMCFTPDEQYALYSTEYGELFKTPIKGGDPVQISPSAGYPCYDMNCTPDGGWIICTERGDRVQTPQGSPMSSTVISVNLHTGDRTVVLAQVDTIGIAYLKLSPDGKQFCYTRQDYGENDFHDYGDQKVGRWNNDILYVKSIPLPAWDPNQQLSVSGAEPKGFVLTGNYPNPFNPSTHIAFTLPSSGVAQLSVYDVTGRRVRDLVSSTLSAGAHEMVWDGRDESGAAVSSGIYIARLKMGNATVSHRMMLIK